jgi:putative phosphoesterase
MRIGLIADTQGSFNIDALIEYVSGQFSDVDEIWHAGDWGIEIVLDGLSRIGPPLVVVNGNAPADPRYPMTIERTIGKWHVTMVHNLRDLPLPRSPERARAGVSAVVIHGHSHRWRDEVVGATRFINPGTATRPQFGGTERTMARVTFGRELEVGKITVPKFVKTSADIMSR